MNKKVFGSINELIDYLQGEHLRGIVNHHKMESLAFIDEAVLKCDMKESKEVLQRIMGL